MDPSPPVPAQTVLQIDEEPAAATAVPPPEKVSILDPKIAKTHTTFYGQQLIMNLSLNEIRWKDL